MTRSFDGKVAIITGGSSGIGRAAAIRFVERGARVLIASRGSYKGNNTVAEIREGRRSDLRPNRRFSGGVG